MRDGVRISAALNEFSFAAVCLTVIAVAVGYLYAHRELPQAPAPAPPCPIAEKAPEITIEQTFFIPVPVYQAPPSPGFTPDPNLDGAPPPAEEKDPVFEHRTPIITSALQQPMQR
jgi:hypothetical protein